MVLLHHHIPSRKRPSSFVSPFPSQKLPKSTTTTYTTNAPPNDVAETSEIDKLVSILAEAGCTLINPSGPPCLPADPHKLRRHLHHAFSYSDNAPTLRSDFLSGLSSYLQSPQNLRRLVFLYIVALVLLLFGFPENLCKKLCEIFNVFSGHSLKRRTRVSVPPEARA